MIKAENAPKSFDSGAFVLKGVFIEVATNFLLSLYNWKRQFFARCDELKAALNHIRDNWRPILNNDTFLTDAEVADRLRVTRRTLHEYRDQGLIPYYAIGGKYIYSQRDIDKVLADHYRSTDIP